MAEEGGRRGRDAEVARAEQRASARAEQQVAARAIRVTPSRTRRRASGRSRQPQSWRHRWRGKGEWNSGLKDFLRDPRAAVLGCCLPCYLFAQTARKITDGRLQFSRAFATYCLVGGCWGAPLSLILGPLAYWLTCVPCYASTMRRQLRHKKGLRERPMDDFAAHCCCHPCALCQEYRESREFDLELVAGPTHPTVDRLPEETARHLAHLQQTQQMER
ncbi:hypothetical protein CLOM_g14238 [Closterium sp. NIES-68]|nr:hypothetical protein CLOM_g14238 [Closterium sp. NIES-68]